MSPLELKTLEMLLRKKAKGISFDDFPRGFRLGARIFDLRQAGHEITTIIEEMSSGTRRARYFLIKMKKGA